MKWVTYDGASARARAPGCSPRTGSTASPPGGTLLPLLGDDGEALAEAALNNIVEHPRLIAQRLERVAAVVGPERVIASTDCGFGTFVGFGRVGSQVAEMKLRAMVEGAALVRA